MFVDVVVTIAAIITGSHGGGDNYKRNSFDNYCQDPKSSLLRWPWT